eukprot:50996_1
MSALSVLTSLISVFSQDRIPYRPIDPLTQRPVSKTKYKKLATKYFHECRSDQLLHEKIWQHKLSSAPHIKEDLSLPTATCIRIRDAVHYINKRVEIRGYLKTQNKTYAHIFLHIVDEMQWDAVGIQCVFKGDICKTKQALELTKSSRSLLTLRGLIVEYKPHQNHQLRVDYFESCDPFYFKVNPFFRRRQRCQYLIDGYIRHTKCCVTMTVDVGQVMQMFIGVLWNDKWDSHLKSKYIEIEGDDVKTTALISCNELYCRSMGFGGCILYENAVFGTKIIYGWPWCQKYRWKIQMVHAIDANATSQIHWRDCFFGVISEDYNRWCAYGYCHRSGYRYHPEPSKVSNDDVYGPILKAGDIIEFELDLEHKTLQYYVNGTDLGIAWNNLENSNYRLIVTMGCKGEEIKLLKSIYY